MRRPFPNGRMGLAGRITRTLSRCVSDSTRKETPPMESGAFWWNAALFWMTGGDLDRTLRPLNVAAQKLLHGLGSAQHRWAAPGTNVVGKVGLEFANTGLHRSPGTGALPSPKQPLTRQNDRRNENAHGDCAQDGAQIKDSPIPEQERKSTFKFRVKHAEDPLAK